jgi:site-specific recombinase XerC
MPAASESRSSSWSGTSGRSSPRHAGRIMAAVTPRPLPALTPRLAGLPTPIGANATSVSRWFDCVVDIEAPLLDGSLAAEREAAEAYARMAKAENTRRAYRAAVRAWCDWCRKRDLPPLPASGADVAAFLASERGRGLTPETLKLRRAAIRYLRRSAGCPVPTDDVAVSETLAGIRRQAARQGQTPRKKVAATAGILRQILAPIPSDLRGLRDRALILTGFAGALRRSELAPIRVEHLEKTKRGLRLTLLQTKGSQTDAVIVPLPYGQTELCPVRAVTAWLEAAGITTRPGVPPVMAPHESTPGRGPSPAPHWRAADHTVGRRPRSSKRAPRKPASAGGTLAGTA